MAARRTKCRSLSVDMQGQPVQLGLLGPQAQPALGVQQGHRSLAQQAQQVMPVRLVRRVPLGLRVPLVLRGMWERPVLLVLRVPLVPQGLRVRPERVSLEQPVPMERQAPLEPPEPPVRMDLTEPLDPRVLSGLRDLPDRLATRGLKV